MKYLIWGVTGQARVVRPILEAMGHQAALLVDNNPEASSPFADLPEVISGTEAARRLAALPEIEGFIVAIGGHHGEDRVRISAGLQRTGRKPLAAIHAQANVSATAILGEGVQLLMGCCVSEYARIGDFAILNTSATIDHDCQLGVGVHIMPGATLAGEVSHRRFCHCRLRGDCAAPPEDRNRRHGRRGRRGDEGRSGGCDGSRRTRASPLRDSMRTRRSRLSFPNPITPARIGHGRQTAICGRTGRPAEQTGRGARAATGGKVVFRCQPPAALLVQFRLAGASDHPISAGRDGDPGDRLAYQARPDHRDRHCPRRLSHPLRVASEADRQWWTRHRRRYRHQAAQSTGIEEHPLADASISSRARRSTRRRSRRFAIR